MVDSASMSSSSSSLTAIDGGSGRALDPRKKKLKKFKSRKYSGMRLIKPSARRVQTVSDSPTSDQSSSDASSVNQSRFEFPAASKEGRDEIDEAESGVIKASAASRNYLKGTSSSAGKKTRSQARNGDDIETKSQTATTSSRNYGFLMNKSSFKYRKPAPKNVNRNTCSSSLKDSKFPSSIELQTGERESLITPIMKVCPYTYCSLHGHHHKPPVPRFRRALSKNRRSFRSRTSIKFRGQSSLRREQCIDDLLKEIDAIDGDPIIQEIAIECCTFGQGSVMETEEQTDLHSDASGAIEEEHEDDDDDDNIAESKPNSEFSSTARLYAPLHNLENATKTVEHEEQADLQAGDSCAKEKADDTEIIAEPIPNSEFLSAEMHSTPLHNLENPTKTREHEEQNNLQADDDASAMQEEDDSYTIAEPYPNSEFLSTEMHNSQLYNLEKASKTRQQHEDSIDVSCSPNSKEGFLKQDCESNQLCPDEDSQQSEKIEASNTLLGRRNQVSMWRLISQHMVLGIPPSDENPKTESNQTEDHEVEVHKIHAVKLVREAIEKILLPEVQDDQSSVCSDITADREELVEENSTMAAANGIKSEKKAIKNWSNLKKWVLLKRFIKELEKVKRLNLSRLQSLPLGTESDGEKVNLRHQTTDVKKKTEEWMLDYALRKVVSELAPTQQKKVALLVKAFETVGPTPEEGSQSFRINGDRNLNVESVGLQTHQDEANIICTESAPLDKVKIFKSLSDGSKLSTDDSSIPSIALSPTSTASISLDDEIEIEEKDGEIVQPGECSPDDVQSERQSPNSSSNLREVLKRRLNRTKGLGMWNLIHQNMVQGLHHKKEGPMPEDSSDSDEKLEIEERKKNTIKLVREAIENILLPAEFQDNQQLLEKKDTEETADELTTTTDATVLKDSVEEKSGKQALKSWGSLKKMILLKRFIKELEKVKKTIKPHGYLPNKSKPEPDHEEGAFHLRRKTTNSDKKNSEEWMLDFALRQVVSELAPVQKRKVALLVKAFETVAPPSEELNLQTAASPKNNKPIIESGSDKSFKLIPEQSPEEEKKSEKSDLDLKSKLASEKTMDKRQYISMWHQLCQHVVSSVDEKVETEQMKYEEETDKKELEFKQSDAIRLVKEAISEIMSQETKDDSSDTQSTCSEQEERQGDNDDKQMAQAVKMIKKDGEGPRKWSKVRKLMILKRTIKAMENARKKYSQRPPQFLPLKEENGAEKIDLRQQMMDERKKAEDWMLDCALQNIVTKLTPARKRRVSMLVEAFEAVVPLPAF